MITSEEKLLSENIALNAQNLQTTIIMSKNIEKLMFILMVLTIVLKSLKLSDLLEN